MNIRPATPHDISFMIALERGCDSAAHWTEVQYRRLFAAEEGGLESLVIVIENAAHADGGQNPHFWQNPPEVGHPPEVEHPVMVGFLVARHVASEWELENIVVEPTAQRKGLGKRLLDACVMRAKETQSEAVFLEVRESNSAARRLYERAGFEQAGRRKCYYSSPIEDAIWYRYRFF
jgi:ribosomal-protein-alanine acetyltransferase